MSSIDLKTILDCISEGVLCLDLESRVQYMNRAARELLGYGDTPVSGKPCRSLVHSDLCESEQCAVEHTIRTGEAIHNVETVLRAKDGRLVPVAISSGALRDEAGRRLGVVEVFRDLSKEKALKEQLSAGVDLEGMVGKSHRMLQIFQVLPAIAASQSAVLIEGESGTGKETVAHVIHRLGPRRNGPFIKAECGALAEGVLESEIFGAGDMADKPGAFEKAHGGTLFLAEVGDMGLAAQAKLLQVLQGEELKGAVGARTLGKDVRVVASTQKELARAVERGEFRRDLYYRLRVVPIHLPPLRERREDVPLLINHFLDKLALRTGKTVTGVSPEAMQLLLSHSYPGNIRELENVLEHAFVLCPEGMIQPAHLPRDVPAVQGDLIGRAIQREDPMDALEKELLLRVLEQTGWAMSEAARSLKVSRTTLWRKLKAHGIRKPR